MAKINLLPWRAERRERRKREFFTHLGLAAVAAIVLVLLWGFWMSLRISNQNERNEYLKAQIQQLDAKIAEIKNLQKVKDHLLARKRIVEKLQSSRSQMVHLFDQVVQTIPAGARLTSLKQQGDKLTLDGVAQSNATVAQYMRNIEASPWMGPAQLVKTENVHSDSNTPYEFELVITLGTPASDDSGAAPAAGSSSAAPAVATTAAPAANASTAAAAAPAPQASATPAAAPGASGPTATADLPAASEPHASAAPVSKGGARP
ncbi:MAG: Type IV pilus biogenesis protein PilN [Rhodanobacteraceae bacterium]|jgi:type IV pilus assembly protein PilN|nr:MAG: Type IV pilus biogenesis protein PilN [Rhodanobacteraceae bacterium]